MIKLIIIAVIVLLERRWVRFQIETGQKSIKEWIKAEIEKF